MKGNTKVVRKAITSAAILGLCTAIIVLISRVYELINYRNFDNYFNNDTQVDSNNGYLFFGIIGSVMSSIFYVLLLVCGPNGRLSHTTLLETALGLQFALGTSIAVEMQNNSTLNSNIKDNIDAFQVTLPTDLYNLYGIHSLR